MDITNEEYNYDQYFDVTSNINSDYDICPVCNGLGATYDPHIDDIHTCDNCDGVGRLVDKDLGI